MPHPIPTRVVPSARPADLAPRRVAREFRRLLDAGATLRVAGEARSHPRRRLLSGGYTPRYRVDLFDTRFYLTNVRQNEDIRFFVAYVVQPSRRGPGGASDVFPRIFYKDLSLVWRSASHFVRSHHENWVGKGDLVVVVADGVEEEVSDESTTNLPLEIQTALEHVSRRPRRIPTDERALALVLRRGPDDRLEPYRDFSGPRARAQADPRNLVNGGRKIARFTRPGDPTSLVFEPGFEPDLRGGRIETSRGRSRLYGGALRRFRILSRNRRVQYLFIAAPRHVWIPACQTTTTELSSYGVRTVDAPVDEDLLVPGYEYHFVDEHADPPVLVSQIPAGFAGDPAPSDGYRADASAWLEALPVVREFRRVVLGHRGAGSAGPVAVGVR